MRGRSAARLKSRQRRSPCLCPRPRPRPRPPALVPIPAAAGATSNVSEAQAGTGPTVRQSAEPGYDLSSHAEGAGEHSTTVGAIRIKSSSLARNSKGAHLGSTNSFTGSFTSNSGKSLRSMLAKGDGGSGRSEGGEDHDDGKGIPDAPLKALIAMAEDECLEAALGGVEVPKLPRVMSVMFTITGLGPCPHSKPWLHQMVKYGLYTSIIIRLGVETVLAVVGTKMDDVSQRKSQTPPLLS